MLDINKIEEGILLRWESEGLPKRLKDRNKGKKKYYFLDGPPNAYGLATHHMWVFTIKDLVTKYRRFAGYEVHDRGGFDVHGLPIENRIERSLNLESKDDIEKKVGVANFVKACRDYVDKEMSESVALLRRFGVTMDYDPYYVPYRSSYIDKGWGIFKKMDEKGLLYKDLKPMAYCPHCGTVLSAQGPEVEYADETDNSLFVRFKVKKSAKIAVPNNTYLVIWTTTPWTLPANMAIAANPKVEYVIATADGINYILAKDRLDAFAQQTNMSLIIKEKFMGSELEGMRYSSPLESQVPTQKDFNKFHKVVTSEQFVLLSEGTGLLHVAPGHGPEDYLLGKTNRIPIFSPVDAAARYTEDAGVYKGLSVPNEANSIILKDLKESGDLLYNGSITHTYPHCWRCHNKLIFRATDQWFINISKIKKKMLRQNEKVIWYPNYAQKWFADAIESSPDWCISRQRFWGAPIPIWLCEKCKQMEVIGSIKELMERSGMQKEPTDMDLHKPHIDLVTFQCKNCNGIMKRVTDTLDVWYESGIAHTASLSDEEFARFYPADWITESLDQIRGWFMTLLRTGVAMDGKTPYKRVTIGGMMKDAMGEEMHRSKGNSVTPSDILSISSADGFRLFVASKPRYLDLKLKKEELIEANSHVIILYNIAELLKELALFPKVNLREVKRPSLNNLDIEDLWLLSRFNTVIERTTNNFDNYLLDEAINELRSFLVEDLSRFYIKSAKQRVSIRSTAEIKRITNLIAYVLKNLVIMLSVVTPFSCEYIYRELFASNGESVLLADWPKPVKKAINTDLEKDMDVAKETITAILSSREKAGIRLRWPIMSATAELKDGASFSSIQRLSRIIEDYVNAKRIEIKIGEGQHDEIKPVFAKLGPSFKDKAPAVAEALKGASPFELKRAVANGGRYTLHTSKGPVEIGAEHFTIVQKEEQGDAIVYKYGRASIDGRIDSELKNEALLREFSRRIQMIRKEMKLKKADEIALSYKGDGELAKLIEKQAVKLKSGLRAKKISNNLEEDQNAVRKELEIEGEKLIVSVKKI